jgi:DNA-binding NarL/FixJ family response regulator
MQKTSILIVDDEESIRVSLESMLKKYYYNVKVYSGGLIALEMLQKDHYDLIISDIMMDDITGIELLKKSKEICPEILVLLMTGYANLETAIEAVRLGASDYLIKPCSKKTILSSINRCLKNNTETKKQKRLTPYPKKDVNTLNEEKYLTKRELQVYEHMVSGMTDKSIANELEVTIPTIKFHLRNIYRKKDVSGRRGILKIMSSLKSH